MNNLILPQITIIIYLVLVLTDKMHDEILLPFYVMMMSLQFQHLQFHFSPIF